MPKTLEREDIEVIVRKLEQHAYCRALSYKSDAQEAAEGLIKAFAEVAPLFPRLPIEQLERKLENVVAKRFSADSRALAEGQAGTTEPFPERLHSELVDTVEEHQHDEPLGGRKLLLATAGALALITVIAGYAFIRWNALNATRPVIAQTSPTANELEVPLEGNFWVRFSRAPALKPSITMQPPDGSLQAVAWDGQTVLVTYSGLHLQRTYTLTLQADYRTKYGDVGTFVDQWRFTTERYPVLVSIDPSDGATVSARIGWISLEFNHRPPVRPVVTLSSVDATLQPGAWTGNVWIVPYAGLKPLTRYQATVVVDYGVAKSDIHRSWSFTTEPGAPPTGVPVVWYSASWPFDQGGEPATQRMLAVDWTGAVVGTSYPFGGREQTPDGSVLLTEDGNFLAGSGASVAPAETAYFPFFADDSRSLCALLNDSFGNVSLFIKQIGGPMRRVAEVGALSAKGGLSLVACSVLANRAVVLAVGPVSAAYVRVLQLTSGRILYQHAYQPGSTYFVAGSHDGRYLAEDTHIENAATGLTETTAVIRRTSDGSVVARLQDQRIIAFSWDDSRVITAPAETGTIRNEVDLVDWGSARILWRLPGAPGTDGTQAVYAIPRPAGADFMVAVGTDPGPTATQLWLVSDDGTAKQLLKSSFYAPFFRVG